MSISVSIKDLRQEIARLLPNRPTWELRFTSGPSFQHSPPHVARIYYIRRTAELRKTRSGHVRSP